MEGDEIAIGALTTHAEVLASPVLAEQYRILGDAEWLIADPLVRNRGTVGGSLCQADPAEDLSAVFSALRATAVIRSATGTRAVPLREFHVGPYETAVGPAEVLTEIRLPIRPGTGSAYLKVHRRAGDWAVAAAGAFVQLQGGTIADAGIGLAAVGAEHFTCEEAEQRLRGEPPSAEVITQAAGLCAEHCHPQADQRGPADYKRHLAAVLVERVVNRAIARARGEED